jgi:hypothetical protein
MRRPQPRTPGRVVDLTRDPMAPPELINQAILDGLDETARQMEQEWSVGRLRLLVDDALRAKFDAQKTKLDAAIATDQEVYVRAQAAGMRRAWQVLDRAATEAGAQPLAPEVWECVLPSSGEVVSIVRTEAEAHHVAREGEVWTLAEVGVLIERMGEEVRKIRRVPPTTSAPTSSTPCCAACAAPRAASAATSSGRCSCCSRRTRSTDSCCPWASWARFATTARSAAAAS